MDIEKRKYSRWGIPLVFLLLWACVLPDMPEAGKVRCLAVSPDIFPAYADSLVLPPNMAPLNFRIKADTFSKGPYFVRFYACDAAGNKIDSLRFRTNRFVQFDIREWKRCMAAAMAGKGEVRLEIFGRSETQWVGYAPKVWKVVSDSIDPYIVYRLSAHDENPCLRLQVVQRSLCDFSQTVLMDNHLIENNCMNCHAGSDNDATKMLVHIRGRYAGTILFHRGKVLKIALPYDYPDLRLAYPSWSADGKFIAFASTRINVHPYVNSFRTQDIITDTLGRILIYDVEHNRLFSSPELMDARYENSFPAWSYDGKTLYFLRTSPWDSINKQGDAKQRLAAFRYRLAAVSFDARTCTFGKVREVFNFGDQAYSLSMPSVSPDERYILATALTVGSFPSQNQGDLVLLKRRVPDAESDFEETDASLLNSPDGEKYHTWSSNGRWVVFGSKRINGATAHIYIAYFDRDGHFSTPFVLPQEQKNFYLKNTRSFLFPTLNRNKADFTAWEWAEAVKREPVYPDMEYFKSYRRKGGPIPAGH